jgi:hypothetical protein
MIQGSDVYPLSPSPHILPDPLLKEIPQREMLPFWSPQLSLKYPVIGLSRFPNGPLQRETPVCRAFFYTFPLKSLVKEPPSMFSNRVPMEREASYPETMVYSFIYICQSPQ